MGHFLVSRYNSLIDGMDSKLLKEEMLAVYKGVKQ